jgi:hypothetical protein
MFDQIWIWIDPLLVVLGMPATDPYRGAALLLIVGLALAVAWILATILDEYRGRDRGGVAPEEPPEISADAGAFDPVLRGKWRLYPTTDTGSQHFDFEGLDPELLGYVIEERIEEYRLLIGAGDTWHAFRNPSFLTDSNKILLLGVHKEIWMENDGVPEELRAEEARIGLHNWKPVLREVADRPLPEKTKFKWNTYDWEVEGVLGPYRIQLDGNTFFQGRELVTFYTLISNEVLYLVVFVQPPGGGHMGGRIALWEEGIEVDPETVDKWKEKEVKVSFQLVENAMAH